MVSSGRWYIVGALFLSTLALANKFPPTQTFCGGLVSTTARLAKGNDLLKAQLEISLASIERVLGLNANDRGKTRFEHPSQPCSYGPFAKRYLRFSDGTNTLYPSVESDSLQDFYVRLLWLRSNLETNPKQTAVFSLNTKGQILSFTQEILSSPLYRYAGHVALEDLETGSSEIRVPVVCLLLGANLVAGLGAAALVAHAEPSDGFGNAASVIGLFSLSQVILTLLPNDSFPPPVVFNVKNKRKVDLSTELHFLARIKEIQDDLMGFQVKGSRKIYFEIPFNLGVGLHVLYDGAQSSLSVAVVGDDEASFADFEATIQELGANPELSIRARKTPFEGFKVRHTFSHQIWRWLHKGIRYLRIPGT